MQKKIPPFQATPKHATIFLHNFVSGNIKQKITVLYRRIFATVCSTL